MANTSEDARWQKLSYNTLRVDVTLAVLELSQKSCSSVSISAVRPLKGLKKRYLRPVQPRAQRQMGGCSEAV